MISVENLTVAFGAKPLFEGANFVVNDHDRIALVGKNGAGKSTLLKVMCGQQQPTEGHMFVSAGTTLGYLPQVMNLQDQTTVREEVRKAFADTVEIARRLEQMQNQLSERSDYDSVEYMQLVDRFTHEHDRYMLLGGGSYEADMERALMGLGFERTDFDRPTREFSGGWRMRVELAKLLLQRPDVLLLDEPTNHLDIESIQWLEQFLAQSGKAVVLVSHDRAFINQVTNRTLEISCGRLVDYRVKYQEYVVLREERRLQQQRAYENQQREIAETKEFIERFRYKPTKAVQVQNRIKQLEKMKLVEVDEVDRSTMRLKFPPCLRSGDFPVICDNVGKAYSEHVVFSDVTLTIRRGEKVAFVGKNGAGKSTLVKCIMGEIPHTGMLKVGHQVQIGYFAQNQAQLLDGSLSVFDTIDRVAKGEMRLKVNDILGAFMFGGEASEKKVSVLSGGERSRLAMIRLLLQPVNFLILDEPTNHLDMASKDVLKEAIKAFDGTTIIVSHDREFLDGLVEKVYEFGHGKVQEYIGGIYDFLQKRNMASLQELEVKAQKENESIEELVEEKSANALSYQEHKERQKQLRKVEKEISEVEKQIDKLETRLREIDQLLCEAENASNLELVNEYSSVSQTLEAKNDRWMELSEDLEKMKNL